MLNFKFLVSHLLGAQLVFWTSAKPELFIYEHPPGFYSATQLPLFDKVARVPAPLSPETEPAAERVVLLAFAH